jgi:HTH-type transcriptional regulator/antitoxin HigA
MSTGKGLETQYLEYGRMDIRPIKTEADYDSALAAVAALLQAAPGSPEGDRLEVLTTLIEADERVHHPMPLPDPIEAIKFRMAQAGLKQVDLIPAIGSKSHVSEVLNRRRKLTLPMIRRLASDFGIPLDILVCDYEIAA